MSAIAGIASPGKIEIVNRMLDKLSHRGPRERLVISSGHATLGVSNTDFQKNTTQKLKKELIACDDAGGRHISSARIINNQLMLKRDELGVMPLYYGKTNGGELCFAAEVKAILEVTNDIHELPPGHQLENKTESAYFKLQQPPFIKKSAQEMAQELRKRLNSSIKKRINAQHTCGSLLSGGLDSSAIAALAKPYVHKLHTFAAGIEGAPDLMHAREVANHIDSCHHEIVIELCDLLDALPNVIYHLESFDALLVRSSLMHYLAAQLASDYVPAVFSGEGGDELFAGYSYLKSLKSEQLPAELLDITSRLHNTALQRVDRCTTAHGIIALVAFLDTDVVNLAVRMPASLKLHNNTEKWILRRSLDGLLPQSVIERPKAKFWEGAGVSDLLSQYAESTICDKDFINERKLYNGMLLNSKEELMYYRIFHGHFGELENLSWMGRTKGAPIAA